MKRWVVITIICVFAVMLMLLAAVTFLLTVCFR